MIRKRSRAQGVQNRRIERHHGPTLSPLADSECRVGRSAVNGLELHQVLLHFDSDGPSTTTNA